MLNPLTKEVLCGGIVRFSIGKDETPFDAHVELLCESSPFFEELFADRFENGDVTSKIISFPDIHEDTFAEFLAWKYRGMIFQNVFTPAWEELFRLWVLADKFGLGRLKALVVAQCAAKNASLGAVVDEDAVEYAFRETPEGNPLRRMAADIWAERANSAQVAAYIPKSPEGFSRLLAVALVEKRMPKSVLQAQHGIAYMSIFEERYSEEDPASERATTDTNKSPTKSKHRADTPKIATETQMAERKIASPRPPSRGMTSSLPSATDFDACRAGRSAVDEHCAEYMRKLKGKMHRNERPLDGFRCD